ncbi:unnamed protein product [Arctogadus glacialis]
MWNNELNALGLHPWWNSKLEANLFPDTVWVTVTRAVSEPRLEEDNITDQDIKFGTDIMQEKCVWEIKGRGRRDKGRIMFTKHEKMDAPSLSKSWYPITLEPRERVKVSALKHSIDPNT